MTPVKFEQVQFSKKNEKNYFDALIVLYVL
jgi:hypothetical protein